MPRSEVSTRSVTSVVSGRPVELPLLAATVDQLDVVVAVQLEVPVGVRGEPVVVAAVQDHRVVVADALAGQQLLEAGPVDEVAADGILQVGLPVQLDGARQVAGVVGGGVLVDLDEDQPGGGQVLLGPFGGHEGLLAAHARAPWFVSGAMMRGMVRATDTPLPAATGQRSPGEGRAVGCCDGAAGAAASGRGTPARTTQRTADPNQVDRTPRGQQRVHGAETTSRS